MNIFCFTGWSGSGKTTLISLLIRELSKRGWKVMAIKKVPDKYHLEPEGKDSRKFLEHGAHTVYLAAKKQLLKIRTIKDPEDLFKLEEKDIKEHDFVLVEGEISEGYYVLEVFNREISEAPKTDKTLISAMISDTVEYDGIKHFKRDDIIGIANFMESIKILKRGTNEKL